jgi:hypothetical protein
VIEVSPTVLEAHPEAIEISPTVLEAHPGVVEVSPSEGEVQNYLDQKVLNTSFFVEKYVFP